MSELEFGRRRTSGHKLTENAVLHATKINWRGSEKKRYNADDVETDETKRAKLGQRETAWEFQYAALLEYGKLCGTYNVDRSDHPLFSWLNTQRRLKMSGKLRTDRQARLQILEDEGKFTWVCSEHFVLIDGTITEQPMPSWDLFFDIVLIYGEENGHCNVPPGFLVFIDDLRYDLGAWVQHQRNLASEGQLPEPLKQMFDILSQENKFLWRLPDDYVLPPINLYNNNVIWTAKFEVVKEYAEVNGHCNIDEIGTKLSLPDGSQFDVAIWIRAQRRRRVAERLPVEYQKKLDMLYLSGFFSWVSEVDNIAIQNDMQSKEIAEEQLWSAWYNVLFWLSRQNGHCNLGSADTVELPDGSEAEIGKWLANQRMAMKALTLRLDRADRLIDLVDDGKLAPSEWNDLSKPYRDRRMLVAVANAAANPFLPNVSSLDAQETTADPVAT